jgi:hypothetical protein
MDSLERLFVFVGAACGEVMFARDEEGALELGSALGWELPLVPPALAALVDDARNVYQSTGRIDAGDDSAEAILAVTRDLAVFVSAMADIEPQLRAELPAAFVAATHIDTRFRTRLFDYLVLRRLERSTPVLWHVLAVAGIAERAERSADPPQFQPAFIEYRIRWDRLRLMLEDPLALMRDVYGWGATFDGEQLFVELARLGMLVGMPGQLRRANPATLAPLVGSVEHAPRALWIPMFDSGDVLLYLLAAFVGTSATPALIVTIGSTGRLATTLDLGDGWSFAIDASAQLAEAATLVIRSDAPSALWFGASPQPSGTLRARLVRETSSGATGIAAAGVRIDLARVELGVVASAASAGATVGAELRFVDGALVIGGSGDDAVLSRLLPDEIRIPWTLAIRWTARGLELEGGAGLDVVIPIERTLGPVALHRLRAHANAGATIEAALTADLEVELGPVSIGVSGLGLAATLATEPGNVGPFDFVLERRAPDGLSLAIANELVHGEGAMVRTDRGYGGALVVELLGHTVSAAGLLESGDASGPSVLLLLGTTLPSVQLGWGFTLDGIGGLIAVNRTVAIDAIRAGLRDGAATRLFDTRAPNDDLLARLDDLAALFPSHPGRHVLGPTFKLGWGTPRIAAIDLAVVLELPQPKIVLLAALHLGIPTLEHPIVDLHLDALGVLDLLRGTLELDGSLHDSNLGGYPLTGDMALRFGVGYGFLLAIGGFHPRFRPPPRFPPVRRITLTAGDNPHLRLEAYIAVTTNTAQVGAHVELGFRGVGLEIAAHAAFDALFVFVPFHFEADISTSASISWKGHRLASVALECTLSGPGRWHAVGHASFAILWWDVSVAFDATWGDLLDLLLPALPDLGSLLRTALGDTTACHGEFPDDEPSWIALASNTSAKLHPFSTAVVRQRALPIELDITAYGNMPLASSQRFAIARCTMDAETIEHDIVHDDFALGQFRQLSTDERLTAPSFESLVSGVRLIAKPTAGSTAPSSLETVTELVDDLAPPASPISHPVLSEFVTAFAATRQPTSAPAPQPPKLRDLRYVLVTTDTLAPVSTEATYAAIAARRAPGLQIALAAHT